jgi:hypothetical protein
MPLTRRLALYPDMSKEANDAIGRFAKSPPRVALGV